MLRSSAHVAPAVLSYARGPAAPRCRARNWLLSLPILIATCASFAQAEESTTPADSQAQVESTPAEDVPAAVEGAQTSDAQPPTIPVTPVTTAPPAAEEPTRRLDEIVVTAQKTRQSLRDVPISVSAISGDQVRQRGIVEVQELVQHTPNIRYQSGTNNLPSIQIRGFGSPPLGRNLEPSVGLSIDDVFYGRSTFTNDAVFDIDRLEVLRGPQGTLFGKNTVAGVLNFSTEPPSMEPRGTLSAAGGNLDERRAEGGVGFPVIADRLAARLSFRARDRRTGLFDTTTGRDNTAGDVSGRLRLQWLLSDDLTADFSYLDSSSRAEGAGFVLEKATERSLERFRRFDPQTVADAWAGTQALDINQFSDRHTRSLSAKLQQGVGDLGFAHDLNLTLIVARATSEAPYRFDTDFSPIPLTSLSSVGPELYVQRSLEARATLNTAAPFGLGESVDWIAGAFAMEASTDVTQFSNLNRNALPDFILAGAGPAGRVPALPDAIAERLTALGLPTDIASLPSIPPLFTDDENQEFTTNILHTRTRSVAAFAQATHHATENLSLVLGARAGHETAEGLQSSTCVPEGGPPCIGAPVFAKQQDFSHQARRGESEFSPKLAISYRATPNFSLFGSLTRGFKSGGFSGPLVAPTNLEYRPERAQSMELGFKSRLFDGSLALNTSLYRVKFDDLQVQLFDGVNITTLNAARATSQGVEADFDWLPPLEFLRLSGSFGLADVSYDHFPCGPAIAGASGTTAECNPSNNPNAQPTQDLTGRTTPFTPRFTGSFTPSVTLPLIPSAGIGGRFGIDVLYQGSQYLDADLDPQKYQPATIKLNARVAIKSLDGPWAVMFNAKNLTGARERAFVLNQNQIVGNYISIPYYHQPTYSLEVRYTWE